MAVSSLDRHTAGRGEPGWRVAVGMVRIFDGADQRRFIGPSTLAVRLGTDAAEDAAEAIERMNHKSS
jgi:hypothetical protein